jgi:metacaspase-1
MGPNATTIVQLILIAFLLFLIVRVANNDESGAKATVSGSAAGPNVSGGSVAYTGALRTLAPRALTGGGSGGGAVGAKKALLFGLNYTGTSNALLGCIQDVVNLRSLLQPKGFTVELCTDSTAQRPTRAVVLQKLTSFFRGLKSTDTAFVWFSGHGALSRGENVWVPLDFRSAGFITEGTLRTLLNGVPSGARVIVGSDSCYSGSFFDLKYDMEPVASRLIEGPFSGTVKAAIRAAAAEAAQERRDIPVPETAGQDRVVPMDDTEPAAPELVWRSTAARRYGLYDIRGFRGLSCDAILISGCRDNQTSADAYQEASFQGAMTWAFIKAAKAPGVTLGALQDLMRSTLATARPRPYSQVPQLSFGTPISPLTGLSAFGL